MVDKKELVSKLKSQHGELKTDLVEAAENFKVKSVDKVDMLLKKFRKDLDEHLTLENQVFYPDYLKESESKGADTSKIKSFISEMVEIGEKVVAFLEKYNSPNRINEKGAEFEQELAQITSTLLLRIETEEDGLYDIYAIS